MFKSYHAKIKALSLLLVLAIVGFAIAARLHPEARKLFIGLSLIPVCGIAIAIWALMTKSKLET